MDRNRQHPNPVIEHIVFFVLYPFLKLCWLDVAKRNLTIRESNSCSSSSVICEVARGLCDFLDPLMT